MDTVPHTASAAQDCVWSAAVLATYVLRTWETLCRSQKPESIVFSRFRAINEVDLGVLCVCACMSVFVTESQRHRSASCQRCFYSTSIYYIPMPRKVQRCPNATSSRVERARIFSIKSNPPTPCRISQWRCNFAHTRRSPDAAELYGLNELAVQRSHFLVPQSMRQHNSAR